MPHMIWTWVKGTTISHHFTFCLSNMQVLIVNQACFKLANPSQTSAMSPQSSLKTGESFFTKQVNKMDDQIY